MEHKNSIFTDEVREAFDWFAKEIEKRPQPKSILEMTPEECSELLEKLKTNETRKYYVL